MAWRQESSALGEEKGSVETSSGFPLFFCLLTCFSGLQQGSFGDYWAGKWVQWRETVMDTWLVGEEGAWEGQIYCHSMDGFSNFTWTFGPFRSCKTPFSTGFCDWPTDWPRRGIGGHTLVLWSQHATSPPQWCPLTGVRVRTGTPLPWSRNGLKCYILPIIRSLCVCR